MHSESKSGQFLAKNQYCLSIDGSINQPINQSINQSIDRSINRFSDLNTVIASDEQPFACQQSAVAVSGKIQVRFVILVWIETPVPVDAPTLGVGCPEHDICARWARCEHFATRCFGQNVRVLPIEAVDPHLKRRGRRRRRRQRRPR